MQIASFAKWADRPTAHPKPDDSPLRGKDGLGNAAARGDFAFWQIDPAPD
ncbi:MAG: hypothetical protein OXP37_04500 [Chloroflexota bacterium]|nr:hypothetical protein [Chloroflexota bacterium]MDE2936083.1 hypothetical protein [Chloroflexota bacterium]